MKRFKSHKIVTAARIVGLEYSKSLFGAMSIEGHATQVPMPRQWYEKHRPEVGGYLVQYEDGYSSYSPAKAFEDGYHYLPSDDGTRHPVWPLRTSCEPEALVQAAAVIELAHDLSPAEVEHMVQLFKETRLGRPMQLMPGPAQPTVVPGLKVINKLPRAESVDSNTTLEIRCDDPSVFCGYVFIVTADWFRATKPELGGGLVPVDGGDPIYYPPGSWLPQLPTRVTKEALEAMIRSVTYEIRPDGRTTVCEITFKNGFSVRGDKVAACIENFRKEVGEAGALEKAMDKAWAFAAFMLREDRYRAGLK